jgi:hypothetical protein
MLERLLREYPEVLDTHVLSKLTETERLLLKRTSKEFADFVKEFGLNSNMNNMNNMNTHKFAPSEFAKSIEMIEFARENGCKITDRFTQFAIYKTGTNCSADDEEEQLRQIDVLKFLVQEKKLCEWDWRATQRASELGNLIVLKWLLEQKCAINEYASIAAAQNGQLDVLEFLEKSKAITQFTPKALARACRNLHLEVIDFLLSRGCQWDDDCLFEEVLVGAALTNGRLDALKWCVESNVCELHDFWPQHCEYAARLGHLECLKWLRTVPKTKWDRANVIKLCKEANTEGALKCLKYVLEECPIGENEIVIR